MRLVRITIRSTHVYLRFPQTFLLRLIKMLKLTLLWIRLVFASGVSVRKYKGFVSLRTVQISSGFVRLFSDAEAAAKTSSCRRYMGKLSSTATSGPEGDVQHVLDGGALLHRIPWPRGTTTYQDICGLYCSYVTKKYGNAIVVFDGYDDMSTKNMTHQRRAAGKAGATVTFTENMKG